MTITAPKETEEALCILDQVSADHLEWLKQVHRSLLFQDADPRPAADGRGVEDGLAEKVSDRTGDCHAALRRLKDARRDMEVTGRCLTGRAAEGLPVDPAGYMAFMNAVETYHAEGRRVELMLHQALAETDPLTGLRNRRGMMRDLRREWMRADRNRETCCVALVDLDHFKEVNDTRGHLTGDKVLAETAAFFLRRLRSYDQVFRFGGEEFLFCLPHTDIPRAKRILDRLRLLMARLPLLDQEGHRFFVSISIGIADMLSRTPPEAAVARADHALYLAKAAGRNRVCVAG
ncbi:MAG TPA: diguanylate cyclase [Rhodospirillaceae bacterium]|nr:diguanylate cyclase [Rhodospirillaceae bacterium]